MTRWPPRTLWSAWSRASRPAACRSSRAWPSPPTSAIAEQQVLGRDVLVAEAAWPRPRPARSTRRARGSSDSEPPWMRARRARMAASSPRNAGRSTPSRRRVSAGMPSSGSTSADRMCSASRIGLSSRWAVAWAAMMASWAFWVKRSSCIVSALLDGSRSAWVGLVDEVEEGPGGRPGLVGQVGRQDDLGLDVAGRRARRP